jgi:hypothetical protein
MAIISVELIDKYELALTLLCEVDEELTPNLCDEIIIEMIEAGESLFSLPNKKEMH